MNTNLSKTHDAFLGLVRLGIGHSNNIDYSDGVDWLRLKALADAQGLSSVILDGINQIYSEGWDAQVAMPQTLRLVWAGEVMQMETRNDEQSRMAGSMGDMFHSNHLRTYVLKGAVIAECYPNSKHRLSADMDCFLLPSDGDFDAWKLGNDLVRAKGYEVGEGFYKNSSFHLPGLTVENHRFMTPFRGNMRLRELEKVLQSMMGLDEGENRFEGTWLYRPPVMVSALFLIEHAYSHFLHEGLTWRMILDWMLFNDKHEDEIDRTKLEALIDEFGFRKFFDSFSRLGEYLIGKLNIESLGVADKKMLEDVWAPLDMHASLQGVKAKFQLAGNYWRARWKYKYFTDMTWIRALMEWVVGAVIERHPRLD